MKTIKIPPKVHQELKRFVADNPQESMIDFAGFAIMNELRLRGHRFLKSKKNASVGKDK